MQLDKSQQEVLKTKGNIVLRSGRQWGKSTTISVLAGDYAAENSKKIILIIASVERQAYELHSKVYNYIYENHKQLLKKGKQFTTKSKIELKNGTKILCLPTGLDGRGIRGYTIDLLIADEAAFIPRAVWDAVTPMISTRIKYGARMVLLSTPFGRDNYFHDCFDDPSFTKFHWSSEECPRIDKNFLIQEKKRMSKIHYAQEYLGEFADGAMQWFKDDLIKERQTLKREDIPLIDNKNKNYYLGSDIARMGEDSSTFQIFEEINGVLFHRENISTQKTKLNETYDFILHLNQKYDFQKIFIDNEGMGVGVYDFLMAHDDTRNKTFGVKNSLMIKQGIEEKRIKYQQEELYTLFLSLLRRKEVDLLDDDNIFFSLRAMKFDYTTDSFGRSHLKIFASDHADTDIPEGLIRAALAIKYKDLNPMVYTINT
jgi:hypothetical protein